MAEDGLRNDCFDGSDFGCSNPMTQHGFDQFLVIEWSGDESFVGSVVTEPYHGAEFRFRKTEVGDVHGVLLLTDVVTDREK